MVFNSTFLHYETVIAPAFPSGADTVTPFKSSAPLEVSYDNIYILDMTRIPYISAFLVKNYSNFIFEIKSITTATNKFALYGQNTNPMDGISGTLLKDGMTLGNTYAIDISEWDYVYWGMQSEFGCYSTIVITLK